MKWTIGLLLIVASVPALATAQVPVTGTLQRIETKTQATPPPATQQQTQQLDTLSRTLEQTDTVKDIEKRLQVLEEQATAGGQADTGAADTRAFLSEPNELLDNLPAWLRRWGQWGLIWGFLWWIPWFVFSWQWWRRRFWVFVWPWPWWWWIPWFWFIPWLVWGWWWLPGWWGWWIWVWWWLPWIFWLPWWLIVLKHVLQWLHTKRP